MGEFATRVQERIRDRLTAACPTYGWETERTIADTPVDVAGRDGDTVGIVELEWRRADPADNTAKLFRHFSAGRVDADRTVVCQVFTGYYNLTRGGISSKRKNAEFVGRIAADALDSLAYHPVELPFDPPKRGGEPPDDWRTTVDDTAATVVDRLP